MKIIFRAATVTISATAALAFMAPAAQADSVGRLTVCVHGLDDGDEADVEIWGRAAWSGDIRGCTSFRAPTGEYMIDIDVSDEYVVVNGDDDRNVRVYSGDRTTVRFWVDDEDDDECDAIDDIDDFDHCDDEDADDDFDSLGDGDGDDDQVEDDRVRFARADDDGDCPPGYRHSRVDEDICIRG